LGLERGRGFGYAPFFISVGEIMILGITGGVATGKSTVLGTLPNLAARRGVLCQVMSADTLARDLLDPGTSYSRDVITHFGCEYALSVEDGVVNRIMLAQRIFSDRDARHWLERLLHPPIIRALNESGTPFKGVPVCSKTGVGLMAMEIPLLYEANIEGIVDLVLVTRCAQDIQIGRIMARRDGVTQDDALFLISAQLPQSEKARRADYVIDTDRPLELVERDIEQVFDSILSWGGASIAS